MLANIKSTKTTKILTNDKELLKNTTHPLLFGEDLRWSNRSNKRLSGKLHIPDGPIFIVESGLNEV